MLDHDCVRLTTVVRSPTPLPTRTDHGTLVADLPTLWTAATTARDRTRLAGTISDSGRT